MGKYIDFETREYARDMVPDHAQESIENYLMWGWTPGGFIESMFAGDLFRAACCADQANGPAMQAIARWISNGAPEGSWGSYEAVENWRTDLDGCRSKFSDKKEKEYIIKTLKA